MSTKNVIVIVGGGNIGVAIARRVGTGKTIVLASLHTERAQADADVLTGSGFDVKVEQADVSNRESIQKLADTCVALGPIVGVVHTAGVSPVQATAEAALKVDLYGTALVLEIFGKVVAPGGSGIVISSQAGYMVPVPAENEKLLAETPTEELLELAILSPEAIPNSAVAYGIAKRANQLRAQAESVVWGDRGARLNSISPGIIITPLAHDEMTGPGAAGYQRMIDNSASKRVGTVDEVAAAAAFLMSDEAGFITGSDLLQDGGVIAGIKAGRIKLG